jgi:hypothetical protein
LSLHILLADIANDVLAIFDNEPPIAVAVAYAAECRSFSDARLCKVVVKRIKRKPADGDTVATIRRMEIEFTRVDDKVLWDGVKLPSDGRHLIQCQNGILPAACFGVSSAGTEHAAEKER